MSMKVMWAGAALGLVLASAASAQIPSTMPACPAGTQYAATEGAGKGPKLAATEGAGKGPKLAATEGAGKGPKLAATEGAGKGPMLASTEGKAVRLSNGVARMPDGTYCSPVQ
jgi:hypothetical protein